MRAGLLECTIAIKSVFMLFRCFGVSNFEGETFVGVECHLPVVFPFGECVEVML